KLTALIVDDDIVVQMVYKTLLRKFGVETHEAKNSQDALLAHHNGACFDLTMMDLDMLVTNDRQATKELRNMHIDSLIVGMTSREKEEEEKLFMNAGLDYYYYYYYY
ncbi:two-component response regulator ARR22-like, partial [Solanum pennellii]|uniref:Two-component response regulator ARR22-like n=1 Tax=Solanum pennellii TaxID=28526 RepID=A0ABM1GBV1_SOLPN